jgi:hypothetical protein
MKKSIFLVLFIFVFLTEIKASFCTRNFFGIVSANPIFQEVDNNSNSN